MSEKIMGWGAMMLIKTEEYIPSLSATASNLLYVSCIIHRLSVTMYWDSQEKAEMWIGR